MSLFQNCYIGSLSITVNCSKQAMQYVKCMPESLAHRYLPNLTFSVCAYSTDSEWHILVCSRPTTHSRVLVNSHLCMVMPSIILPHNFVYQIKELSSRDATIIDSLALTAPAHIHAEVPSFCNVQYGKARASIIYVFVPPFHFFVICMGRGGYRNHVWKTPCKSLHE